MLQFNRSPPEIMKTFCSTVAANILIAAHRRKISGASSDSVFSMKDSMNDRHFRLASPFVLAFVVFEPVEVGFAGAILAPRIRSIPTAILPFVPAGLAVVRNL